MLGLVNFDSIWSILTVRLDKATNILLESVLEAPI